MSSPDDRLEHDSMGELRVPAGALWGAQTQRAIANFPISGLRLPPAFLQAVAQIKAAAAVANQSLGLLDEPRAIAIAQAANAVATGKYADQFPLDVFQTGSGTSTNMNVNEVVARLAALQLEVAVHANDHVNIGQSSNDVIPAAIHISCALRLQHLLLPALAQLADAIASRESALNNIVKTGRTHLMDAMPLTLGQELSGWRTQIEQCAARLREVLPRLLQLPLGGTAVGTGVNAHPEFGVRCCAALAKSTGLPFSVTPNHFAAMSAQDTAVELSGQLKVLAVAIMKISNDLRWMNSGPLAGLAEIQLPALQPGSSIMPGKVNPVIPEAAAMVAAQVIGNDASITIAGQSGNFQLNVMLPLIAHNLLQSLQLLGHVSTLLAERAIAGFSVNESRLQDSLARNPVLVTALNPVIGYEQAAAIAKEALTLGEPVLEVALRRTSLTRAQLSALLNPVRLTGEGA